MFARPKKAFNTFFFFLLIALADAIANKKLSHSLSFAQESLSSSLEWSQTGGFETLGKLFIFRGFSMSESGRLQKEFHCDSAVNLKNHE